MTTRERLPTSSLHGGVAQPADAWQLLGPFPVPPSITVCPPPTPIYSPLHPRRGSVKYERMRKLDQDAIRTLPDAWRALCKGSAILKRPLLDLLWQGEEFAPHKTELIDIMERFSVMTKGFELLDLLALCKLKSSVDHAAHTR